MNNNKSVTLIFGAYFSHKHIYRTCKNLNKKFKIIVVENSLDKKFKQDIEKKYKNTKVIIPEKNVGLAKSYNIGIKNSKKQDGFVKVYLNENLIQDYEGITFDWSGNYIGTDIRIGPYRDSDPEGKGYPDQIIHYDDFIVVSDKKTLDKYLN